MSNVILYESTATDFFNQGLGPLTEAKDPKVTEVGNGEFYLELDYPTTGRLFNQLKNGNLIKSDAGHELKDQRFEIKRVVKSMKKGHVSVYAEHISNQALDIALPANVTLSGSAQTALQQAQSNGLGTFKPFTMSSNITTTNQTKLSIREFKNLKQALGGVEGSILDTWGGEYKFDNYHISLFKKRGRQANAMIAYGRNLVDLEQEENIMNTFTSVYPYAVWRDKEGAEHIIEGSVIHSSHADKYPHHKVLPVDFTLEVEDDTKPTATRLNQLAAAYIDNNDIGIPEVSIKLTHLDLSKTLDYKEYAEVEKLNVFDEVKIYFADFNINTTAKIVRTVWNVNLRRYDEIEVGKVRASLSDRINTIGKQISEARKEAQDARNVSMVAANGVNMVFFGPDEPTATKIGDRWFMEDGQYTISKVWDGVIWRVISDPRLSDQNAQLISEQKDQIDDMKLDVDYSYDQLQQTIANSGFTDLDTAFGNVKTLSEQAESNAHNAMQKAIDNASLIGGLDDSISTMSVEIDDINNSLTLKANTTDINRIDGTIVDINNELTFQSGELSSKVSQTVYNADINSIETTQTELTQTFEDFETSVIGPTGRLTLAEQFLDGFRNTAFDPETGQLSLTEQTINGLQDTVSDPVNGLETRVTTIANGFQVLSNDVDGLEAQLSVTNENVLARVQKGDVISQINLEAESTLIQTGKLLLDTGTVVFGGDAFIPGAYIEDASIDTAQIADAAITSAKILNLDVSQIVGNTSDFIYSAWNDGQTGVQISPDGLLTYGPNGGRTYMRNGGLDFTNNLGAQVGYIGVGYSNQTDDTGILLGGVEGHHIEFGRWKGESYEIFMRIPHEVDELKMFRHIDMQQNWSIMNVNRIRFGGTYSGLNLNQDNRMSLIGENGVELGHGDVDNWITNLSVRKEIIYAYAELKMLNNQRFSSNKFALDDTDWGLTMSTDSRVSLVSNNGINMGAGTFSSWTTTASFRGDITYFYKPIDMGGQNILNVNAIRMKDREWGMGILSDGRLGIYSENGIQLSHGTASSSYAVMSIRSNRVYVYQTLDMLNNSIVNNSDERLKDVLGNTQLDSLDIIKSWNFVDYYWKDQTNQPGKQFGLIAQDTEALMTYNEEEDIYGINSSKQVMMNSHGLQQLAIAHENVVTLASKASLKAESNEERIEKLEAELKLLKGAS